MYHSYLTILIPSIVTFVITVMASLFVNSYMKDAGVTAIDHNKGYKKTLATSGGVAIAFGITLGVLTYVFGASFPSPMSPLYSPASPLEYLFATVLSIILITLVGLLDDINVKKTLVKSTDMLDTRKGIKQWQKPILTFIGALPLMAINAGISTLRVPLIGAVNFGIFYPLVIIPLAIIFVANAFNLLGGFDGIASGTSTLASLALLIYSVFFGTYTGAMLSAILFAALVAFLIFNRYPATILPGDSFTYGVGTALVVTMIIGNMEAFGVIVFLPWIIEFVLHARRKFKVTDLGKRRSDGTFEAPYGKKIYSWTHIIMNIKRCKEWEVSLYMWFIEIGFIALAFALKFVALL